MRITIEEASDLLLAGKNVAIPTETVYGLAACLDNKEAIERIFEIKGRPSDNPLIIHVAQKEQVYAMGETFPPHFEKLAEAFWPGAMTLVIPVSEEKISAIVRANLMTAAFRMPAHPIARQVIERCGPLAMPSANLSGRPSPTMTEHVEADFGVDFPVVDGGVCMAGLESTVLIFEKRWQIIRLGALAPEIFVDVLGYLPEIVESSGRGKIQCPGQRYRHYAPQAKLKLIKKVPDHAKGMIIGFSDRIYPKSVTVISLGHSRDAEEVAHNLFQVLRQLDVDGITEAFVDIDLPAHGLWLSIKERLTKAADEKAPI